MHPTSNKLPAVDQGQANWQALRAPLMVMPPVLMTFSNPALYTPAILKAVLPGRQGLLILFFLQQPVATPGGTKITIEQ